MQFWNLGRHALKTVNQDLISALMEVAQSDWRKDHKHNSMET
jgi:hypothetical protein